MRFSDKFVAPLCDPLTHRIGELVLTNTTLMPLWRLLTRLPMMAWTSFNNTVVMGSFWLGLALMAPVYRLSLPWMERLHRRLENDADCDADAQEEPCVLPFTAPRQQPAEGFAEPEPAAPAPTADRQAHSTEAQEEKRCA